MKFLLLAALPALVAAQNYGAPPDPAPASSTSSSAAPIPSNVHQVTVGQANGLSFTPNALTAQVGDQIQFMFNEVDGSIMHSVTQSSFSNPCTQLAGGFASGFQSSGSMWTLNITNITAPTWFYCTQQTPLKHCNMGMVGSINAPTSGNNVMSNFVAAASTAADPANNASGILTGIGAVATAPAGIPSASPSASSSGAAKLIASAGSLLAGVFTLVYTLA